MPNDPSAFGAADSPFAYPDAPPEPGKFLAAYFDSSTFGLCISTRSIAISPSIIRWRKSTASPMTHEEMAQRIGASRETVTRLLSDLRRKRLIRLDRPTLVIRDRSALEALTV
jgi:CRP-like cAMP-binding protein